MPAIVVSDLQVPCNQQTKCAITFPQGNKKIKNLFLNSQSIYNSTFQPVCMYSTTLTHVVLKKSSGHKSRHIFKFHIFPYTSQHQNRYPFLHKILSLFTEQDEFDIVLANSGCHTRCQF